MITAERPSLGSLPAVRRLFEQTLDALMGEIPAQRCVLLFGEGSDQELRPRASRGVDLDQFWQNAPLSLTLLREVRRDGAPRLMHEVPTDERLSLVLAGVRSLLCVPFWGPSGAIEGLLYADTRSISQSFTQDHVSRVSRLALALTQKLEKVARTGEEPEPPAPVMVAPAPARSAPVRAAREVRPVVVPHVPVAPPRARPTPAPTSARARRTLAKPSLSHALMVHYRGVATLLGAGVGLTRALQLLALQCEHPQLREALIATLRKLDSGHRLSSAMSEHPHVFSPIQVALVQVGEETGALHQVMERLARHQEKNTALRSKLVSALAYPAFVTGACLLMLIVVPAFTFQGLLSFLEGLQVPLPWTTRLLIGALHILGSPWLGAVAVVAVLALLGARRWLRQASAQRAVQQSLERVPGLGRALRAASLAGMARTLATLYAAGAPVVKALELAGGASPLLMREALAVAREEVLEGRSLHEALGRSGYFPPMLVHIVAAGESVGQVSSMLEKTADLAEEDVDQALLMAVAALQPLVLAGVGFLTGFMVLAMMSPLISVAQSL